MPAGVKRKREDIGPDGQVLRVQAFEADLVRDRPNLADAVERRDGAGGGRGGLIRWGESEVWVDRCVHDFLGYIVLSSNVAGVNDGLFDARLLLSPSSLSSPTREYDDPLADVGWSDLPSDSEDTFFLTSREVAEYRHEKRKREMEQGRLDRLRALAEQDQDHDEVYERDRAEEEAKWGGSDEEVRFIWPTSPPQAPTAANITPPKLATHPNFSRTCTLPNRHHPSATQLNTSPTKRKRT
ncbi:hypothetical protein FRC08_011034 [Ceratobasidium sp. 394]|nr:hypothetical protein FRC08_011034 [Ceratobasidium sp. 394]